MNLTLLNVFFLCVWVGNKSCDKCFFFFFQKDKLALCGFCVYDNDVCFKYSILLFIRLAVAFKISQTHADIHTTIYLIKLESGEPHTDTQTHTRYFS